jgi:hypothetical protein
MRDRLHGDRCGARRAASTARRRASRPIVLWRLRGATDDLRGLAVETSFGYALGLELDTELVLLHLQPSLECLVAYADRIESALVAQGWRVIDAPAAEGSRHVSR